MEVTWLGHSCFRLKGKEATVITDPFDQASGYSLGKPTAHIVTLSHSHPHHSFVAGIGGEPRVIRSPGEYEIANVLITGIPTFHDANLGKSWGKNTVYIIEIDEVVVCHLGDLGHVPSSEQVEEMADVDILLVPVGGVSTIDAVKAAETVSLVAPKIVIPMHFKTEAARMQLESLDSFLKEMGDTEVAPKPKLTVSRSSLPEETEVVVLSYRGSP